MNTRNILFGLLLAFASTTFAQKDTYQLSSHILDITLGQPAANVKIALSKHDDQGQWTIVDEKYTDANGRIADFLKVNDGLKHTGIYKLTYYTKPYFENLNQVSFYPYIEVIFEIGDANHYHVPITLSAFGYSTYRGN